MAPRKEIAHMNNVVYDIILWSFSILVDLFFREVHPRGSWKVPRRGPVIFVAAPHANQFVDPLILMRVLRREAHRRIAFLIAEKSMRRQFIGPAARAVGSIPVGRALDMTKSAPGRIYLPFPESDPLLIRGVGTKFDRAEVQIGGLLVLPTVNSAAASAEILEVLGPEEIKLKKPFRGDDAYQQLTGRNNATQGAGDQKEPLEGYDGTPFKTAPKVDQTEVYDAVFARLDEGGCVGIFPEGGSHDRTELLPLKAGVAIMALGTLNRNPNCGLKIIPCGMNYFHAHKFRSRAVVEFGSPIEVPPELVELYGSGERREAVRLLLETVYQALVAVTVTSPDYDTLMVIQAARRLYKPTGKKLPLPMVVELNRRMVKGYTHYKDDPRIINLKKSVMEYNKQLWLLGIRDHQVEYAKISAFKVIFMLFYRVGKLILLTIATLPGLFLFAPVFVAAKLISIKKSREALAASTVKIQGRDVMATWKLLVAMGFAPILYAFYTTLFTWMTYRNRIWGIVPNWVPLWSVVIALNIVFPTITFAALRFGEIGMDIFKSLRPLVLSLNPTGSNTLVKLRARRENLAAEVTDLINTLGPEMYPDFDSTRIVADPFSDGHAPAVYSPTFNKDTDPFTSSSPSRSQPAPPHHHHHPNTSNTSISTNSITYDGANHTHNNHNHIPRNESFGNLGSIGLFATRPPSRSRSRSSSSGGLAGSAAFPVKGFSTLDAQGSFDEVTMKIRGAMKERGEKRRRSSRKKSEASSGAATPGGSEDGKKVV